MNPTGITISFVYPFLDHKNKTEVNIVRKINPILPFLNLNHVLSRNIFLRPHHLSPGVNDISQYTNKRFLQDIR